MQFERLLAALLLLTGITFGQIKTATPAIDKAHNASYHIAQETITGTSICSATAMGPQALITATHCELPTDNIEVVGQNIYTDDTVIVGRIRDSLDHTIYLIKGVTFPVYVNVVEKQSIIGDDVFTFGNPGDWTDIYQKGYVVSIKYDTSSKEGDQKPPEILLDLQAYEGTSGSGIFNTNGDLIIVESLNEIQTHQDVEIAFAAAYPLFFSKTELQRAVTFTTPPEPKSKPAPPVTKQ